MEENNSQENNKISTYIPGQEEENNENNTEEIIREIQINSREASKQIKLNILGIEVFFPYEPYENQILYMKKVIEALQTNGIAGLESPTGTGKTLCLLCASLAYLKHIREELIKEGSKQRQPVIFYTTRTHAQITNIIKELKKTVYKPINSIVSSREQSCVNDYINQLSGGILNLKCKYARRKGECKYFKGKHLEGKGWSAYDNLTVDELKEKGKKYRFCPFFFEKEKSQHSDIVFLPYNYIFDSKILKRTKLILENSIIIIDEAHNLEEVCRDSSSIDLDTNILDDIVSDLKDLKSYLKDYQQLNKGNAIFSPGTGSGEINTNYLNDEITILKILKERIMNIKIGKNKNKMENPGIQLKPEDFFKLIFKKYKGSQTTIQFLNKSTDENENNVDNNDTILEKSESDKEIKPELNRNNIIKHIGFLRNVEYFINNDRGKGTLISVYCDFLEIIDKLSDNYYDKDAKNDPLNYYTNSFKFYIEEISNPKSNNKKNKNSYIKRILHIYCFNPGFGFSLVMEKKFYSTIITSGTLSPIDMMESELKHNFTIKLENDHVVSNEQFHFCLLTSTIDNKIPFNFKAENRFNTEMIYQLGLTILELCKITPGGILVFFSSYNIMDSYVKEWSDKNIISEISKYKEFYQDRREQRQNKAILNKYTMANSDRTKYKGGILLSVCRGSCSEGMNFNDDMARLVIVIGIPYAMLYDPKIQLKKEFQDEFNKLCSTGSNQYSKIKKLSSNEWYTQNAIKCVNQSLGRVIRHSNDYGSMLLIDTRYQNLIRKNYISKWMRNKCKIYNNENTNKNFYSDMKNFFINAEKIIKNRKENLKTKNSMTKNNIEKSAYTTIKKEKSKKSKNTQIIIETMNDLEKNEFRSAKFLINSKNRKIQEIKIGNQNNNKEEEIKDKQDFNLEDLNDIDESFFENLSETPNQNQLNAKKEISDKELIDEIIKKKNDKNFIEELEKEGIEVKDGINENQTQNTNSLSCKVCYRNTKEDNIKLEVGKCGHILCQNCWCAIESKKGKAICPLCRQIVKKGERNIIYI